MQHELKRGVVPNQSNVTRMNLELQNTKLQNTLYIHYLIGEMWKKIFNHYRNTSSLLPKTFVDITMNLARMANYIYQNGDGHSTQDSETKHRIESLLIKTININKDR